MIKDSVLGGVSAIRMRGGRGLGDSIYLRPIADHYAKTAKCRVMVLTDYPQVFLGARVTTTPFQRVRVDINAHYVGGKAHAGTTQWQDVCASAGVSVPLSIPWKLRNAELVRQLREKAKGKPLVLVHGGRKPMNRNDGFGMELMPSAQAFDAVLEELSDCFLVQVGRAEQLYPLRTALDLNGSTSVADLLDLGSSCDGIVAQCSFAVPLAEAFDKPLLALWGARYKSSRELFIRQTSPLKVLSGAKDCFVVDDWERDLIQEGAREWARRMKEERR